MQTSEAAKLSPVFPRRFRLCQGSSAFSIVDLTSNREIVAFACAEQQTKKDEMNCS